MRVQANMNKNIGYTVTPLVMFIDGEWRTENTIRDDDGHHCVEVDGQWVKITASLKQGMVK